MTFLNFTIPSWSPLITYNSGKNVWQDVSTTDTSGIPSHNISFVTNGLHANATLSFTGISITIYGSKGPNNGNYTVQLDNEPVINDDGHIDGTISQVPLWSAQNLNNSQHTVVITNKHTSQGISFDLDFVSVGREIGPPGYTGTIFNTTFDDTSPSIVYNGTGWVAFSSSTGFNNTLHSTMEGGSSLSLHFRGSSIELYGINANAQFLAQVDDRIPTQIVLGTANPVFDFQHQSPQTLLFYMDGLDENTTHVVTLINSETNTNEKNPLYFDYAIVRSSQDFFEVVEDIPTPKSRPPATGTIVGSVVGGVGFVVLGLIALFFLCRRRRSLYSKPTAIIDVGAVDYGITPVAEVTPYVYCNPTQREVKATQVSNDTPASHTIDGQGTNFPPVPTLFTNMHANVIEPSSQHEDTSATNTTHPNTPSQALLDQPQENLSISGTSIVQGRYANQFVQNLHLPPVYDENWRRTTPYQLSSSQ